MKRLILLFTLLPISYFGQYSSYYNVNSNSRVSGNVNVNKNVRVSGNTTQTISTIDYGALAKANAERERIKLEAIQYADEKARRQAIEIASNPIKAYEYGNNFTWDYSKKNLRTTANKLGFKKFKFTQRILHSSLFNSTGGGRYENVSYNGITTEYWVFPVFKVKSEKAKKFKPNQAEIFCRMDSVIVGELNDFPEGQMFVHKKDINRAVIQSKKGFKGTLIYEDSYEYTISDTYLVYYQNSTGVWFGATAKVRYFGDKDEITFEDLEGRRHYLHQVIEKVISSAYGSDWQYISKF
jgi:hypothetical protein